mmetsp:Transcript_13957/g.49109  ORF Transcript_13957/g.49109 Transcript_13957/m.49109 type:complete len:454 (+) Transcript_13957:429-1790(+)
MVVAASHGATQVDDDGRDVHQGKKNGLFGHALNRQLQQLGARVDGLRQPHARARVALDLLQSGCIQANERCCLWHGHKQLDSYQHIVTGTGSSCRGCTCDHGIAHEGLVGTRLQGDGILQIHLRLRQLRGIDVRVDAQRRHALHETRPEVLQLVAQGLHRRNQTLRDLAHGPLRSHVPVHGQDETGNLDAATRVEHPMLEPRLPTNSDDVGGDGLQCRDGPFQGSSEAHHLLRVMGLGPWRHASRIHVNLHACRLNQVLHARLHKVGDKGRNHRSDPRLALLDLLVAASEHADLVRDLPEGVLHAREDDLLRGAGDAELLQIRPWEELVLLTHLHQCSRQLLDCPDPVTATAQDCAGLGLGDEDLDGQTRWSRRDDQSRRHGYVRNLQATAGTGRWHYGWFAFPLRLATDMLKKSQADEVVASVRHRSPSWEPQLAGQRYHMCQDGHHRQMQT